jgi:PAS domain S-box-containing protein
MTEAQILVVEDEYIVAKDIQETLSSLGYHVPSIAASGDEALKIIMEEQPDIVLMDIVLKGELDGIQTADKIRLKYDIPVIYLTAYADDATLKRAKVTEPYGYLIKPYQERELHSTIEMALYRQRMENKLKESKQWLSTTLNSIGDGVIATNDSGEIKFINPTAEMWLGRKEEELLNQKFDDVFKIINDTSKKSITSPISSVLNHGKVIEISEIILQQTEENFEMPIELCASPMKDEHGSVFGVVLVFSDITLRKEAEQVLKESEDRYRELVNNFPESMMVYSEGKLKYMNPETVRLFGASGLEELIGKSILEFVHEHYKDDLNARLRELEGGLERQKAVKIKVLTLDGVTKDVDISASHILYYGKPAVQLVMKDITAGRKAEDILRESEEKYRSVVERANDGIAIIQDGLLKYVNPGIERMAGYEADELLESSFLDYLRHDQVQKVGDYYKRRLSGEDVPNIYEAVIIDKEGIEKEIEINAGLITYEGRVADLVLIRDITERKEVEKALRESEESYRKLIETTPYAIITIDLKGIIQTINRQALSVYGCKKEDELIGKNVIEFITPEDRDRAIENMKKGMKGESIKNIIYKLYHRDGSEYYGELNSSLLVDSENNPTGFIGVLRDITERLKMTQALKESEGKYRSLVEESLQGIVILQVSPFRVAFANPAITNIYGYTPEELMSFSQEQLLNLIHPEDQNKYQERFLARIEGKLKSHQTDLRIIHKDGSIRWISSYANLIEINGKPAVQATSIDITERKRMEKALLESEEKYRLLVDNINDGVYTLDENGYFTFVNKVIEDRSGLTIEQFNKLKFADIVLEKDIDRVKQNFDKIMAGGNVPPYELIYKTSSGEPLAVEVNTKPIYKEGKIIGLQGISRDITERKITEKKLKDSEVQLTNILNSMGDAIHVVDGDLNIVMMNDFFKQWNKELGLESHVRGKNIIDIYPFLSDRVTEEYKKVFETGITHTSNENVKIDDREFYTETRKIPIIKNGKVIQVITVIRDMSEIIKKQ